MNIILKSVSILGLLLATSACESNAFVVRPTIWTPQQYTNGHQVFPGAGECIWADAGNCYPVEDKMAWQHYLYDINGNQVGLAPANLRMPNVSPIYHPFEYK